MKQSLESAQELDCAKRYLESLPEFKYAVKMYGKLGFKNIKELLGLLGHTSCNI